MKNQTGIWITFMEALLINLEDQQEVNAVHISSDIETLQDEQVGNFGNYREEAIAASTLSEGLRARQEQAFFDNIMSDLDDRAELYIFGPAEAKFQLENALLQNNRFSNNILAVESAEEMNTQQKVSRVKQFFKSRFFVLI